MQFENFDQVRPWAPLISLKVASREMPPYAYDHGIGIQELDGRLATRPRKTLILIVEWVNQRFPFRRPADIVPIMLLNYLILVIGISRQQFGEPDLIVASVPMDIPANAAMIYGSRALRADTGVTAKSLS